MFGFVLIKMQKILLHKYFCEFNFYYKFTFANCLIIIKKIILFLTCNFTFICKYTPCNVTFLRHPSHRIHDMTTRHSGFFALPNWDGRITSVLRALPILALPFSYIFVLLLSANFAKRIDLNDW